jgi:hypothetical protein
MPESRSVPRAAIVTSWEFKNAKALQRFVLDEDKKTALIQSKGGELAPGLLMTARSLVASGFHAQNHPNDVWR